MVHISGHLAVEAESSRMRAGSSGRAETDDMARATTMMDLKNMFDKREREKGKSVVDWCDVEKMRNAFVVVVVEERNEKKTIPPDCIYVLYRYLTMFWA